MTAKISEYKGHPVISITLVSGKEFTFGAEKAKAILEHLEAIQQFSINQTPNPETEEAVTVESPLSILRKIEHKDENGVWVFDQNNTSKFLRKLLRLNFPNAKFSVISKTYATWIYLREGDVSYEAFNRLLAPFPDAVNISDSMTDYFAKRSQPIVIEGQAVQLHYGWGSSQYPHYQSDDGNFTGDFEYVANYAAYHPGTVRWQKEEIVQ